MSKIIVDVTYLAHWQGNLTGIPRVINELAIRYAASAQEAVFVSWDDQAKDFFEVDIYKTIVNHGKSLHYLPADNSQQNASRHKVAYFSGRALRKAKVAYKMPVPDKAVQGLLQYGDTGRRPMAIESGDILFLPMGEWHNDGYIKRVLQAYNQSAKLVQVSHDVLPLVQPQYSGHSTVNQHRYNTAVMPLCDLVLANSQNTKRDLEKWLKSEGLKVPVIGVFRLGDDFKKIAPQPPSDPAFKAILHNQTNYILCVGTIEARKNHTLLYYVYKLALKRSVTLPPLIIVGRLGWMTGDFYELVTKDPETKDRIIVLKDINDAQLAWLYDHAQLTVYPSFYEGWGLPIAESLLRGVPCIASNTSSMPEIAGDLIEYFSPTSTDEFLKLLERTLKPAELTKAIQKTKKYKVTSWDDTFAQVNGYIKELL